MDDIELFILKIPKFYDKTPSQLIDYFAFFLLEIRGQNDISSVQINECFQNVDMLPYSNISTYLGRNAAKGGKYIKKKLVNIYSNDLLENK